MEIPALILGSLSALSLASVAVKRPWTMVLARRHNPPEVWTTDLFLETNRVITGGWALLFASAALLSVVAPLWVNLAYGALLLGLGHHSPRFGSWYAARRLRAMGLAHPVAARGAGAGLRGREPQDQ